MREIRMTKAKLQEVVERNRAEHVAEYETLLKAWQAATVKRLEQAGDRLAEAYSVEKMGRFDVLATLDLSSVPKPQSHAEDYDRALDQLEYEVRDELTLGEREFDQLVRDDWGWTVDFRNTGIAYRSESAEYPTSSR